MSPRDMAAVLLLMCILLASGLPARGEMYQWTDDQGRTRYSDTPPPDRAAEEIVGRELQDSVENHGVSPGRASDYPMYAGQAPSKLMVVSLPKLWLDEGRRGRYTVGLVRSGRHCDVKRPLHLNNGQWFPLVSDGVRKIRDGMRRSGFTVDEVDHFSPAQYRLSAFVTQVRTESCLANGATVKRANASVEVRWELETFTGSSLFSRTTTGRWSGRGAQWHDAVANAFHDASAGLFKDGEFIDFLDPTTAEVMAPKRAPNVYDGAEIPPLAFDFDTQPGLDFDAISRSVVTVRVRQGHGSGFVVAPGGWVLTNWHVVKGLSEVSLIVGRREVPATVMRANPERDVALLKADVPLEAPPLPLAPKNPHVGESIYVVGTPLQEALSQTVTRGIISAVRNRGSIPLLQTDAALSPGNSGGPALNEAGQVVGIAVAGTFSRGGGSLSINYLIPIDDALAQMALRSSTEGAPAAIRPGFWPW